MKQTRWLSEFSCLSEYTRLYPRTDVSSGTRGLISHLKFKSTPVLCVCEQRRLCRVCTFVQTRPSLHCSTIRLVQNSCGGSFMNHLVRVIIILFVLRLLQIVPGGRVRTRSVVKAISRMEVTDQTRLLFGKITSSIPTNSYSEIEFHNLFS